MTLTEQSVRRNSDVSMGDLSGTYGSGSAYVCVYDSGRLFASESACP